MLSFLKKKKKPSDLTTVSDAQVSEVQRTPLPRPGRMAVLQEKKADAYYMKLANRARVLRYAVTVFLLIFAVTMTFFYSDEITAENFGLLLRNASFSFPGENTAFETVRYDADLRMDFAPYKEYFAVATTTGLRLYDHRGNIVLNENVAMKYPRIETGENYIMVYDKEGKNYLICNSVTAIREGSCDGTLYDADMTDRGNYVLVESSARYLSVVTVYNKSFNVERELMIDRYALMAELSEKADKLLFVSYRTGEDGVFEGHVSFYKLSETTELLTDYVYTDLPLSAFFAESGAVVIFKDRAIFYGEDGKEESSIFFGEHVPVLMSFSKDILALSFEENDVLAENLLWCVDLRNRTVKKEFSYKGRIKNLWVAEELLFVSEKNETVCFSTDTWEEVHMVTDLPENLFFGTKNALFICYENKAENIYQKISSLRKSEEV